MTKKPHQSKSGPKKRTPSKKSAPSDDARVETLLQENETLKQSLQRERADSENIRRRHEAQLKELQEFVAADTIRSLLPVIDNIERALAHIPEDIADHEYVKGVHGVAKQFVATLEKLGVEKIQTVGETFDPSVHEAISMDDSAGSGEEIVSEELQSGYVMGDHIIRHAMVRVALQDKKKHKKS